MRFEVAINQTKPLSPRAEALASGNARYIGGRPCRFGHVAERYSNNGACVVCHGVLSRASELREPVEKMRVRRRESRERNAEAVKKASLARRDDPRCALRRAERRKAAPDLHKQKDRETYAKNREARRASTKRWQASNPEKTKAARRACYEKRMKRPDVRISAFLSARIGRHLRSGGKRGGRTFDILPYSAADLIAHLTRLFQPGMTLDNYGAWHIDHVIPLAAFNFETVEHIDFQRAWALSNLQPLWASDNMSKGARIDAPFQPSLAL